jgi:hypothetical protein
MKSVCLILGSFLLLQTAYAMPWLNRQGCAIDLGDTNAETLAIVDQTENLVRTVRFAVDAKMLHPYLLGRVYLNGIRGDARANFASYLPTHLASHLSGIWAGYGANDGNILSVQITKNLAEVEQQALLFIETHPGLEGKLNEQSRFAIRKLAFETVHLRPIGRDRDLADVVNKAPPRDDGE